MIVKTLMKRPEYSDSNSCTIILSQGFVQMKDLFSVCGCMWR